MNPFYGLLLVTEKISKIELEAGQLASAHPKNI